MSSKRPTISRRALVAGIASIPLVATASKLWAEEEKESQLIYVSPLKSDGTVSRCQAEVWYLGDGGHMYVVTASGAWRAEAVRKGLTSAQIWVGDAGVWTRSGGKYKELPQITATASFETDASVHARLLEKFGAKYAGNGWSRWERRWKTGLADGSRAMLKYTQA